MRQALVGYAPWYLDSLIPSKTIQWFNTQNPFHLINSKEGERNTLSAGLSVATENMRERDSRPWKYPHGFIVRLL